jgi:hypothetical protein
VHKQDGGNHVRQPGVVNPVALVHQAPGALGVSAGRSFGRLPRL